MSETQPSRIDSVSDTREKDNDKDKSEKDRRGKRKKEKVQGEEGKNPGGEITESTCQESQVDYCQVNIGIFIVIST